MIVKGVRKEILDRIRRNPDKSGLRYEDFGRSGDFREYSDEEIKEMYYGVYKGTGHLLVDGDYFININDVVQTGCMLETVTYYRKPTKRDLKDNTHNAIQNIRTFYVKNYFLITKNEANRAEQHIITRYLWKTGAIHAGRNRFSKLYSIGNDYRVLQEFKNGLFPKDLYDPIKRNINGLFFKDDYRISDFVVVSNIKIKLG